jgi:hypothetical protein
MRTTTLIHDEAAYKIEAVLTRHACGTTLELYTVWPGANHPVPNRLLTLTLPAASFARLTALFEGLKSQV